MVACTELVGVIGPPGNGNLDHQVQIRQLDVERHLEAAHDSRLHVVLEARFRHDERDLEASNGHARQPGSG